MIPREGEGMNDEPLRLTLEEALKRLYGAGFVLVPPGHNTETWGASVAADPDEEWSTWPEAVSAAIGRPVVERDDTAELVAALERLLARVKDEEEFTVLTWELIEATEVARAALARVRGEP